MGVFGAVFPIFMIIMTGYGLRIFFIKSDEFWFQADRLIYFFLMPLMLVQILAQAKFDPHMLLKGLTIFGVVSFMAVLCFGMRKLMGATGPQFTSVFQGVVRVNFYMSLSLASLTYGKEGVQFLSFLLVFLIPSATIYSVIVLQRYGMVTAKEAGGTIFRRLSRNPVIIATFVGLGMGAVFDGLPSVINETLDIFGDATLPLALLGIGAALHFDVLGKTLRPIMFSSVLRLVIAPAVCLIICFSLGFSHKETLLCTFIFAVPTAASAISFASQMGGDKQLMSAILTVQTVLSFITIAVLISVVGLLF